LRGILELSKEASQKEVVKEAKVLVGVAKHLRSKKIKKTIFVRGKIVNFVVSRDNVERLADSV
jgi:leucyl-tRNA synthetase